MNKISLAGMATLAALCAIPVAAQSAGAFMANPAFRDPPPARCVSTLELQRCAAHELRTADAAMAARYADLRAHLRPAARQTLLAEQRAWLRSRDRDCLARGGGGSMASLVVARCWIEKTRARTKVLAGRSPQGAPGAGAPDASAFVGRWRGGEGTYMKIARRGGGFAIDNRWGLDANMQGVFAGTITAKGLVFRRNGVAETIRPGRGSEVNRSALVGKTDCLVVSRDEGYCRY